MVSPRFFSKSGAEAAVTGRLAPRVVPKPRAATQSGGAARRAAAIARAARTPSSHAASPEAPASRPRAGDSAHAGRAAMEAHQPTGVRHVIEDRKAIKTF